MPLTELTRSASSAWLLLAVAVLGEIVGAISLRYSEGFTRIFPISVALMSFGVALFLVSRVMRELPVSVAYPLWAGGGTVGVSICGILVFDEAMGLNKALGVGLILAGAVLINHKVPRKGPC